MGSNRATTLVADPPWPFKDRLPGGGRGAAKHYNLLSIEDICKFELPELADDCRLFLWRVSSMQLEALQVCEAWGFNVKSEMVWVKTTYPLTERDPHTGQFTHTGHSLKLAFGMGRQVRNVHETCIIAVRGRPERLSNSIPSVFFAQRGKHSAKPEEFFDLVEMLSPGPYVELFARRERKGWLCLGNEIPQEAG